MAHKPPIGPRGYENSPDYDKIKVQEKGPWFVDFWSSKYEGGRPRVVLQSDDFHFDAALEITGDFGSLDTTVKYARMLAEHLNKMSKE